MVLLIRVVVAFATVTFAATAAQGQTTWYVDDDNCPGPGSGTQEDPFCDLADAIGVAGGGDEIWVREGIYKPAGPDGDRTATFQLKNGVAIFGGFPTGGGDGTFDARDPDTFVTILTGDLNGDDIAVSCTQDSPDCDSFGGRCIDAFCIVKQNNDENSYHIVTASGTDATAILDGFTVTGGNADGEFAPHSLGGGMYNNDGDPTLRNCKFTRNAADVGAGMYTSGSPTLVNCVFTANKAAGSGGGLTLSGDYTTLSGDSFTLVNCVFNGNAANRDGGGIYTINGAVSTLTNCRFAGNSAGYGGGITFNTHFDIILTLTNCMFTGNSAAFDGGGIVETNSEGVYLLTVTNCTFSGNTAGGTGGGISTTTSRQLILTNCILWGNSDSGGTNESAQVTAVRPIVNYCCIEGWTNTLLNAIGNIDNDPLFVDPDGSDNIIGTNDDDLRLLPGSPCNDAGNNTAVPTDVADLDGDGVTDEEIPFDLDGNPRLWDDPVAADSGNGIPPIVDMGAYEQVDCNGNGVRDDLDILAETSEDCTGNGAPDECEPDCNTNTIADSCDIAAGTSDDCTGNGIPDECEPDCNTNGIADSCDIAAQTSDDCTGNGIPDECDPDCNNNGVADPCDILDGTNQDVNGNGVPDECDPVIYVRAGAAGVTNGTSWTNAYDDMQDALAAALPGDHIWVASGTYHPDRGTDSQEATFQLISGVAIYGGFAGVEQRLDERNPSKHLTMLSGDLNGDDAPVSCTQGSPDCDSYGGRCIDGSCIVKQNNTENSYHVVNGSKTHITAVLDGFIITAGNANGSYPDDRGGGMYNFSGSLTVSGCTFAGNFARSSGSGIYNESSSPRLRSCTFTGNVASSTGSGGGMWNSYGNPTLTNCTFIGNSTGKGGGMYSLAGNPALLNCLFIANMSGRGGGMYSTGGNPTLTGCAFSGNLAVGEGGGFYNRNGTPSLTNCMFTGNVSQRPSFGGGGGGMYTSGDRGATLTNCTFSGNSAIFDGGGLYVQYSDGLATLANCILWGNSDAGGMDESAQVGSYGFRVVNYSCIQGLTETLGGTGNIGDAPLFIDADGPDGMVGTADDNLRLMDASPCIDAGDNSMTTESTDLDGNPRILDGDGDGIAVIDLGAYEFQGADAPIPTVSEWGIIVMILLTLAAGTLILMTKESGAVD